MIAQRRKPLRDHFFQDAALYGFVGRGRIAPPPAVALHCLGGRDKSLGAHNPKYTRQIMYDAYFATTGLPPTTIIRPQ